MNLPHQLRCDRLIGGKLHDPAVCLHRGARLPLRTCMQFLGRNVGPDRLIQLSLGELCTLNPAGSSHLTLELQLLERFDPALLKWQRGQCPHSRLGLDQSLHDGICVI